MNKKEKTEFNRCNIKKHLIHSLHMSQNYYLKTYLLSYFLSQQKEIEEQKENFYKIWQSESNNSLKVKINIKLKCALN